MPDVALEVAHAFLESVNGWNHRALEVLERPADALFNRLVQKLDKIFRVLWETYSILCTAFIRQAWVGAALLMMMIK